MAAYKVDPEVLAKIAKEVVGLPLHNGELVDRTIELLAAEYPDLIDATPGRWVGSRAGGILGKVRFLYFSPREYIVLFGSPTGTQGFSGRYKRVQITSSCWRARSTPTTWSPTTSSVRRCAPASTRAWRRDTPGG